MIMMPTDMAWLEQFSRDEAIWPQYPLADLAVGLLDHCQSPDPNMRDRLSYTLLDRLITRNYLTETDMQAIIERAATFERVVAGVLTD